MIQYANIASLVLHEQVAATPGQFVDVSLPIDNPLFKGIGALAFGSFASPNYLNTQQVIPSTPTGQPAGPLTRAQPVAPCRYLPSSPPLAGAAIRW